MTLARRCGTAPMWEAAPAPAIRVRQVTPPAVDVRPAMGISRRTPLVILLGAALVAVSTAAEEHRFSEGWRAQVEPALTPNEVMSMGERTPVDGRPGDFTVRIPREALVPKFVESVAIVQTNDGNVVASQPPGPVLASFVVRTPSGAVADALPVAFTRTRAGRYRVASQDRHSLANWLLNHLDALDAGLVAVRSVEGLPIGGQSKPAVILSPPTS